MITSTQNAMQPMQAGGIPRVRRPQMPQVGQPGQVPQAPQPGLAAPQGPAMPSTNPIPSVGAAVSQAAPGKPLAPVPALNPSVGAPTGPANVSPSTPGALSPAPATPPAPPNVPGASGYASLSQIDPKADLRSTTITPGAQADRLGMAKGAFEDYLTEKLPQYRADLRSSVQNNAAFGRLGSGMLRTDAGNLQDAFDRNANLTYSSLLRDATDKSVNDQANYRNELRGERGYENELEDQAFNRGRQQVFDTDALTGSQFGRDLALGQFAYGGNPAGYVGQAAGNASANAGQAAQSFQDLLMQQALGGGIQKKPQPTAPLVGGNTPGVPGAGVDEKALLDWFKKNNVTGAVAQ